jgi:Uncharacterized protein, homolog of phage Mu protein gp30
VKQLRTTSAKPAVLSPIFPNAGVQAWYLNTLESMINLSTSALITEIAKAWALTPPIWHNSHITSAYGDAELWIDPHAAGIVLRVGERILLLHRTDGQGWAFPGGTIEPDETADAAARRETFEETLHPINGPLDFLHMQEWQGVRFATFVYDVPEEFIPQLNSEHDAYKWVSPRDALRHGLHPGARSTIKLLRALPSLAMDAPSPTKALQAALAKWGQQTIKRFDLASQKIADDFAARNRNATQAAMLAQLKKAGFTVKFEPTHKSIEAFRVVAAENVSLIKSIPRKYHGEVEQKVWNAVRNGSDLSKLSTELRKAHRITVNRAALIARDQNAKAKAVIERVRQQELGINKGIWMHSNAGKEPRPTHVQMDNRPYDLARGMWDKDEGEWVHPGQLINCRCTMRPVIAGFED